jgi:hypothetical protein
LKGDFRHGIRSIAFDFCGQGGAGKFSVPPLDMGRTGGGDGAGRGNLAESTVPNFSVSPLSGGERIVSAACDFSNGQRRWP